MAEFRVSAFDESEMNHERPELRAGAGHDPIRHGRPVEGTPPFRAIYDEYFDFVWRCARALGVTDDAMDDAVQEIFLVIHTRVHTLNKPTALRSWIYGVTRRVASDYRRSGRIRDVWTVPVGGEIDVATGEPTPLDAAALREDLGLLHRLLSKLDPAKREAFILAELLGMTGAEIAEAAQVPLNTAYSRLRVARAEFDSALAEQRAKSGNA